MQYIIREPGKTTMYEGIGKELPADVIALIADEDTVDVFALDHVAQLAGIERYCEDTPCTHLLGVYIRHESEIEPHLLDHFKPEDYELAKSIMHRLPRYLRTAFAAMVKPRDHA